MKFKLIKEGLKNINVYQHHGVSTGDVVELAPEFAEDAATKPKVWKRVSERKSPAKKKANKRGK